MISQVLTIHLRASEEKQNVFCLYIVTDEVSLRSASYSACVVYTETIIPSIVGESGGYLITSTSVNNCQRASRAKTRGWRGGSIIEPCERTEIKVT